MPDDFHPEIYRFAAFELNISTERLLLEGQEIPLTPKAFTLLTYFARNPNRLIKYEELVDVGWPEVDRELRQFNKSKYTQQVVDLIRDALNDHPPYSIITNKSKRGYVFEPKVNQSPGPLDSDVSPQERQLVPEWEEGQGESRAPFAPETTRTGLSVPEDGGRPYSDGDLESKRAENSSMPEVSHDENIVSEAEVFFENWMFGQGRDLAILVVSLVFATLVAAAFISLNSSSHAAAFVCTASVLLLILALRHSSKNNPRNQRREPKPEELVAAGYESLGDYLSAKETLQKSLQRFVKRWWFLLFSWVPLYCTYAFDFWSSPDGANLPIPRWKVGVHLIELLLNLANTFIIGLCYEVLNRDMAPRRKRRTLNLSSSVGLGVFFLTVTVVIAFSLKPEQIEQIRSHLQFGAALLTGILAGIIMALFVGRLQSKYLDPPAWVVFFLFSYTAIQPLVLYIQDLRQLTWALLWYALFLKSLLYLYVFWLLQSGDLLFYFAQTKRTYEYVDDRRRAHRRLIE